MNFRISNQKIFVFAFLCFFIFFSFIIMSNAYAFEGMDLNNDGYPDIVFSNRKNNITNNIDSYIYWGSATGFDPNLRTALPSHGATGNSLADLNNDGYLDIVFCNSQNDTTYNIDSYIYWGSATGYHPDNLTRLPTHKAFGASVADLNNDAYKDIIFSNLSDDVTTDIASYIYWGSATGFDPNMRTELPTQGAVDNSVADLNNDGYPDIVFSSFFSGQAGSYYHGTFKVDSYIYWGSAAGFDAGNATRLPTYGAHGNSVADLNSDGYLDIIFSNHCNDSTGDIDSYIYWGSAAGYSQNLRTGLPTIGASDNSVADMNNDGYPDIIFSNCNLGGNRSIDSYIYWGSATGFDPNMRTALPTHYAQGNSAADFNDDGFLDIVFSNHSKDGELSTNSYIYWGADTGFDPNIRSELPTHGAYGVSTSVRSPGMIRSLHVFPGESIQEAINNANSGDAIVVHPGTYSENIHFSSLSITVRSLNPSDPDVVSATVIDGTQSGSVVTFGAGAGPHSILNGLTLKNGKAVNGGGIYCGKSSSPKILNCIIAENVGTTDGGGIYCDEYSSPFISGCRIIGNAVPDFYTGQTLSNSQTKYGGGIYCKDYSSPSIIHCHIIDNTAFSHGGGIFCRPDSSVIISQCHFEGNLAYRGGGISFWHCSPKIINCIFSENSTSGHNGGGAGIYSYHASPTIINSVIRANTAYSSTGYALGGGIRSSNCTPTITNCTIVGNSASYTGTGGAMYLWGTTAVITNCIIWDSSPAQNGESPSVTITYSDVEGGYSGTGNINTDPLFINQNEGDLHLQAGSPCIDSGTNTGAPADDKDGLIRPQDGDGDGVSVCDMGAYEASPGQAPAEYTLWQIGYPHGDIGSENGNKEFPDGWSYIEKYDYYVGSDPDPINHPSMPGVLGTSQTQIHKLMTAELNINFSLERDYASGELLLVYDWYGSKNDIIYLDGVKIANVYGTENDGIVFGAEFFETEQIYIGLDFDGVDDYVKVESISAMSSWTLSVWVNPDVVDVTLDGTSDGMNIFANDRSGWNDDVLLGIVPEITSISSNKRFAVIHQDNNTHMRTIVEDTVDAIAGNWYHVTAVSNSTDLKLYINGVERNSIPKAGNDLNFDGTDVFIGSARTGGYRVWDGFISKVCIYNRALTSEEILSNYQGNIIEDSNLILHHDYTYGHANDLTDNYEDAFQHLVLPLCSLLSGAHTITFAYDYGGIDGGHRIDYINLSVLATEPIPSPGPGPDTYVYNGHEYRIVMAASITWEAARQAAINAGGYLATVTTPSEQIFIETILPENARELWLGGYQTSPSDDPSANWAWVTGEPWIYTNWKSTEPNDSHGYASEEHLGIVISTKKWNDECYLRNINGYIVESPINEDKILYDDFDDGVLDPAWSMKFEDATGWEFEESGTNLTVTDIHPATINYESNGTWAKAILSRTIIPVGDFTLNFDFSWDSGYNYAAMQNLFVSLCSDDHKILMVGYRDAWVSGNGIKFACVGGYKGDCIEAGSLPSSGSASIQVYRFGSEMKVLWDGTEIFSQNDPSPINKVNIEFWYYGYNSCAYYPIGYQPDYSIYPGIIDPIFPWPPYPPYPPILYYYNISHFGTESVDLIHISGEPFVPVQESKIFKILATSVDCGVEYVNKSDVILGITDLAETIPVPGPPPEYTVFMKIEDLSDPFSYLYQELREKGNGQEKWLLNIEVPEEIIDNFPDTYHPLLSWDSYGSYDAGSFKLWSSNADGELLTLLVPDMEQMETYQTMAEDGRYFCVEWSDAISVNMNLPAGWSMISLPVDAPDKTIASLFPESEAVFDFDIIYLLKDQDDSMEIGKGYWIYVPTDQNYTITGIPIDSYTKEAPAGWSMIGACSHPSDISVDQGFIKALFGFMDMYVLYGSGNSMDPMEPGRGFWINLTDPASLMVSGNKGTRLRLFSDSGRTRLKSNTAQSDTGVWSLFIVAEGLDLGTDFVNKAGVVIGVDDAIKMVLIPPAPSQHTVNMKIRDRSSSLTYYQDVRRQENESEVWILKVEVPEEIIGSSGNVYPLLTWYPDRTIPGILELRLGKEGDIEDRPLLIEDMNWIHEYQTMENDGTYSLWYSIVYIPDSLSDLSQYNDNNNGGGVISIYPQGFGLQWYLWPGKPLLGSASSEFYPFFSGFNPFWPWLQQQLPLDGFSGLDQQFRVNFGSPWYPYDAQWGNQWDFIIPGLPLMMWMGPQ